MKQSSLLRALVVLAGVVAAASLASVGCTSKARTSGGDGNEEGGAGSSGNPGGAGGVDPGTNGGSAGVTSGGSSGAGAGDGGSGDSAGGMDGAGGEDSPPTGLGLGRLCGGDLDCASLHCADGVCCESDCSEACAECGGDGRCNVTPADDAACGTITCPSDTTCRDYEDQLTTRRCASFGTCKGAGACAATDAPLRTVCGAGRICDGAGACDYPPVRCGSVSACRTANCCNETGTPSCLTAGTACGANTAVIACDGPEDCPPTQMCCGISPNSAAPFRSVCDVQTNCTSNPGRSVSRLCNPNGNDCGALSCVAFNVPGMYRCQ